MYRLFPQRSNAILDTETGELTPRRKSPKTGTIYQIIPELYKIKMFISNPRLHFIISLIVAHGIKIARLYLKNFTIYADVSDIRTDFDLMVGRIRGIIV